MSGALQKGRAAFDRQAWAQAYEQLTAAEGDLTLEVDDLERLAASAYLAGLRAESARAWTRAHQDCLRRGEAARAARSGFRLAIAHLNNGEAAQGGGWIDRAARALDEAGVDCVERGYLRCADALRAVFAGDAAAAYAGFTESAAVGERYGDAELVAMGRVGEGRCLIYLGRIADGVARLDEAMVAVSANDVSPITVGDMYCTAIEGYHEVFDVARLREWTDVLSRWCDGQPELVLYRGQCLLHRAEVMALAGEWQQAQTEVAQACDRLAQPFHPAIAAASYLRADLARLRGLADRAEQGYQQASELGVDPQPGLALLRLDQGRRPQAEAAIRRAWQQAQDPVTRARLATAYVEITLAAGAVADARPAVEELASLPEELQGPYLRAVHDHLDGWVRLAADDPTAASALRRAAGRWRELGMPYHLARVRVLLAQACRDLGDREGAALEIAAARGVFQRLGALPDVARADAVLGEERPTAGLTARELEVLALVARGRSNRQIAADLVISEKTVASHLGHILAKLDVPSRSAATAYAYENDLLR